MFEFVKKIPKSLSIGVEDLGMNNGQENQVKVVIVFFLIIFIIYLILTQSLLLFFRLYLIIIFSNKVIYLIYSFSYFKCLELLDFMYSKSEIGTKLLSLFEYEEAYVLDKLIVVSGVDRGIDMIEVIPLAYDKDENNKNLEIPMLSGVISKMILASEGEILAGKLLALAEQFVCYFSLSIAFNTYS